MWAILLVQTVTWPYYILYGGTNAIRENRLICNISAIFIHIRWMKYKITLVYDENVGKARRLKQAKDEATEEIEKYRSERDKQFKDFEAKVWNYHLSE